MKQLLTLLTALFITSISVGQCGDLFFSEYIEGSSSNKAFEIYNPTSDDIDLTDYVVYRNNNGSLTPTDSLFPLGTLLAGDVFVVANPSANPAIMAESDTTHTITFYNGDDAVWLKKISTGDTLDKIGDIGVDPGSGWPVGAGATNNNTLIRMIGITVGQTDWPLGSTEWDVFPIDMTDSLGFHSMIAYSFVTYSEFTDTVCDEMTSPSGLYVWDESGVYMDTILNEIGCDSIMTFNLTVNSSSGALITVSACDSLVSPSEAYVWTTSGFYNDTITNAAGCDSIIAVNLTITHPSGSYAEITVCDSLESPSGAYVWTETGTYNDTIPNVAGCDSAMVIGLTVLNSAATTETTAACKFYISPSGHYWTSGGTYSDTLTTMDGCDSVITINLTIYNVDVTVTQDGAVLTANNAGAFYQWLDCNEGYAEIDGQTDQSFTATENGSYAVEIFQDGCTDTSDCYLVENAALIENGLESLLHVYPNPTQQTFKIDLGMRPALTKVTIYDLSGKRINTQFFVESRVLDLSLIGDSGSYIVEVLADDYHPVHIKMTKIE